MAGKAGWNVKICGRFRAQRVFLAAESGVRGENPKMKARIRMRWMKMIMLSHTTVNSAEKVCVCRHRRAIIIARSVSDTRGVSFLSAVVNLLEHAFGKA